MFRNLSNGSAGPRPSNLDAPSVVKRARDIVNPFEELNISPVLSHSSLSNLNVKHVTGDELPEADRAWVIGSIENSLKSLYDSSQMQWDRQEKLGDMCDRHQRLIMVSHADIGDRLAFLSFRWDIEEGVPIMYVYELFVDARVRGKRVGFALMRFAEDLCRKQNIRRVMLTVFCANKPAMQLYRARLGYGIDEDSPSRYGITDVGYEILSKQL